MTADVSLVAAEASASVSAVCRALGLPRSTAYARRTRGVSARELANRRLDVEVAAVFAEHRGRYGAPRVHGELRAKGPLGKNRVARRMRALGLAARRPKRFRRTTEADNTKAPAPNLLGREFHRDQPNQAWVGDITYVWTQRGWVYLAILVDLCTRGIVGWAVSRRCDAELALLALNRAVARHRPPPGLLYHTDRGSTYTADDHRERLRELQMVCSMSRKGNCWDNAVAESTIGTIKAELFEGLVPVDLHEVERALFAYIEGYYNRRRRHSTLDYRSPMEHQAWIEARGARAA